MRLGPPLALPLAAALVGCVDLSPPALPTGTDAGIPETAPPPIPEPAGLRLYWAFDDPNGAPAADGSGNGFRGTYLGFTGSPLRSALAAPVTFANPASREFDGNDRHAVLLDPMPTMLNPSAELTLAVWYRATSVDPAGGGSEVISLGNNQLVRLRAADIEVSKRKLGTDGWEAHVRCFAPVSGHLDGAWHHLAVVIDRSAVRIHFDGAQRCLLPDADPLTYDLGNELWIGRHPSSASYDFSGQLDDVRIYDRALTVTEVTALAARRR